MPAFVSPELQQILTWIHDGARSELDAILKGRQKFMAQDAVGEFIDCTAERQAYLRQLVGAAERGVALLRQP